MYQNTAKVRTQLKKDIEAHWNLARNFIPLPGEPIVYMPDEEHEAPRLKVGDGTTYVVDLPFLTANSTDNAYVKSGTTEYWNNQLGYVPPENMIIVYTDKDEAAPGIKIGDGNAYCVDLPFVGDDIMQKLGKHINDTVVHITQEEREFWNNKINTTDFLVDENLILTRN